MAPTAHFPDLSHYEAQVDFHAVAAAGCPLVITKCTEGTSYTDPTYQPFAERIRSVPLLLGAYAFLKAEDAGAQIAHFLDVSHLQTGDIQPFVDAEELGLDQFETFAALTDLEIQGYQPILYCSIAFWRDVLKCPTRWWLWIAAYRDTLPNLPADVKLFGWQHSQNAACPGVAHLCDMSYLYVAVEDLPKFCIP